MKKNIVSMELMCTVFPILVCFLLYGQVVFFEYVWDDIIIFLNKNSLVVDSLSWTLLTMPVLDGTSYMRPAVMFSWWLEFKVFGQNPAVSHAINLIFFCINVYLVSRVSFHLVRKINPDAAALISSLVALAYATHPALIESTAWVAGRFDLLCTTGILGASLFYLRLSDNVVRRYLCLVLFVILALLSKELGVVAPFILFCIGMAFYSSPERSLLQNVKGVLKREPVLWVLVFLTIVVYFFVRKHSMVTIYHEPWSFEYLRVALSRLEPLEAISGYIGIAFFPFNGLGIFHPPVAEDARDIVYYFKLLLSFVLFCLVVWSALAKQQPWAWLMVAAGFGIVLVLHFIPMTISDNLIQERFITTSLAYICIAVGLLPWNRLFSLENKRSLINPKKFLLFISLIWFLLATITTITIVPMWKRDLLLWSWTYQQHPALESVRSGFLNSSVLANRFDLAKAELQNLIRNNDSLTITDRYYYGLILMGENNPESMVYFKSVVDEFSDMDDGDYTPIGNLPVLAATYKYYAFSVLAFNNDVEGAIKYINLSDELISSGEKGFIYFAKAAVYYADGQFELADSWVEKGRSNYFHYSENAIEQMYQLLSVYCSWAKVEEEKRMEVCSDLAKKNII